MQPSGYGLFMTHQRSWPASLSLAAGQQVRHYRDERKLSAEGLARAVSNLGVPYTRAQVTGLETGRRESVTLGELLAIGAVLGVPPALLAFPLATQDQVEILPSRYASAWSAYLGFIGQQPFAPDVNPDARAVLDNGTTPVETYQMYRQALAACDTARTDQDRINALTWLSNVLWMIRSRGWAAPDDAPTDLAGEIQRLQAKLHAKAPAGEESE